MEQLVTFQAPRIWNELFESNLSYINQLNLLSFKACKGVTYLFHKKCFEIKQTLSFEGIAQKKWKFAMKFNNPYFLSASHTGLKILNCLILMRTFQN